MGEGDIEVMIEEALEALEAHPDRFTAWERDFLESVEEQNEQGHLSSFQVAKLEEICEEKVR